MDGIEIKTIFFDIGNVLIYVHKEQAFAELSRKLHLSASGEWISSIMEQEERFERGEVGTAEYFQRISELLHLDGLDPARVLTPVLQKAFSPNPFLIAQLEPLKRRYRIYLLSNTNPYHMRLINNAYGLNRKVHGELYSYQLGSLKPEEEIFRKALELTGSIPEETLFIDDLLENVEAARRLGIHSVRFINNVQLKGELKRYAIRLQHPFKLNRKAG